MSPPPVASAKARNLLARVKAGADSVDRSRSPSRSARRSSVRVRPAIKVWSRVNHMVTQNKIRDTNRTEENQIVSCK